MTRVTSLQRRGVSRARIQVYSQGSRAKVKATRCFVYVSILKTAGTKALLLEYKSMRNMQQVEAGLHGDDEDASLRPRGLGLPATRPG